MEQTINAIDIDDAKDIFLLAKDRLLDINDWKTLLGSTPYDVQLTNEKNNKVHRDARINDKVTINHFEQQQPSISAVISNIQYDYFPDMDSECISLLLNKDEDLKPNEHYRSTTSETVLIRRTGQHLTAHLNIGNELPDINDILPFEHINPIVDLHPVLNLPKSQLETLLKAFIS